MQKTKTFIYKYFSAAKKYFFAHKLKSVLIILAISGVSFYGGTKLFGSNDTETRYTLESVKRSTISSTVSGTGQVSGSNEVELKAKASGRITSINVKTGDFVKSGTTLISIDSRDAQIGLLNAQIALAKIKKEASALTLLEAENSKKSAEEAKIKAYDDAFTNITESLSNLGDYFVDFELILNDRSGYLNESNTFPMGENIRNSRKIVEKSYWTAKKSLDATLDEFKKISRQSKEIEITRVLSLTKKELGLFSQMLKDAKSTVDLMKEESGSNDADNLSTSNTISTLSTNTNNDLNTIISSENSTKESERSLKEKEANLADVKDGSDPLDIQGAELDLREKQYAYENYFIKAPFDGIVAKMNVKQTDDVTSGTSAITFITKQKVAVISLTEVDVSKIQVGQKATLSFDAIENLEVTGEVLELDFVGTVSQGVVTYEVKLGFATDDERIKSGMSVSAAIIIEEKMDVLAIPLSAVKTERGGTYIETIANTNGESGKSVSGNPTRINVVTGMSNDTMIEIISGLNEGDKIVTKTTEGVAKTSAAAPSLLGNMRGTGTRTQSR